MLYNIIDIKSIVKNCYILMTCHNFKASAIFGFTNTDRSK